MYNISKNTTIILFAFLISAMVLPISSTNAIAEKQPVYDPVVVEYIEELIAQPGKNTDEREIDGQTVTVITNVKQLDDNKYSVKTKTKINGEQVTSQYFKIKVNDDGTYKLVNNNLGIKETFTDTPQGAVGAGSGNSTISSARIDLYDREYGTPQLSLYDDYFGCGNLKQAMFTATVRSNNVDVSWVGSAYYLHWCLVPHEFDHGKMQYSTNVILLNWQDDRKGNHAFTNTDVGTAYYSVEVDFVYGAW